MTKRVMIEGGRRSGRTATLTAAIAALNQKIANGMAIPVSRMQPQVPKPPTNEITCSRCGGTGKAPGKPRPNRYPKLCRECLGHGKMVL